MCDLPGFPSYGRAPSCQRSPVVCCLQVFDLLNQRKKLNILEDGKRKVVVVGLKEFVVSSVDLVKNLIQVCLGFRG